MTEKQPTSEKRDSETGDATDPATLDADKGETSEETKALQDQQDTSETPAEGENNDPEDETPHDTDAPDEPTANHEKDSDAAVAPNDDGAHPTATVAESQKSGVPRGRNVVLALILGGIVAAGAGFGAGRYLISDPRLVDIRADLEQQQETVADLQDSLSDTQGYADRIAQVETTAQENAERIDNISQTVSTLESQLSETSDRLAELSVRPADGGGSGDQANAAFAQELTALREALAAQRAEIEKLTSSAEEQQAEAELSAQEAMTRAALSRIGAALDSGAGFAAAVDDLRDAGVEVPDDLEAVAADGVATLSSLQERFPDLAREALAEARQASGEATDDVMGFLRAQLGLRSLEPREGNDPDAVLSRAEAALRDGRLTDTLAGVEQLPEEARAVLSGWISDATRRRNATAAAEALAQTLNSN